MANIKSPKKVKVIADHEQEPFELDQIKCPVCSTIQEARIYPDRKVFKHIHKCTCCSHMIYKGEWASII